MVQRHVERARQTSDMKKAVPEWMLQNIEEASRERHGAFSSLIRIPDIGGKKTTP